MMKSALRILPYAIVVAMGLSGGLALCAVIQDFFVLEEAGYGDSYILYDVLRVQKGGDIYRDLSKAPYLPAQYSPLVYLSFAIPGKVLPLSNPFVGPRLLVLAAFAACLILTVSIVRTLIPARRSSLFAVCMVLSLTVLWTWPLQIRGDFPGIAFGLLSVRLLLSVRDSDSNAAVLSGLAAGIAMQFKLTYVAALITGLVWLATGRRWRPFMQFAIAGFISSAGLYLLYAVREPGMFSQILALSPGVRDFPGARMLLHTVVGEAVFLLALVGLPVVLARPRRRMRWAPLLIYAGTALAVGAVTSLQAGANVNYYFESAFALTALAVAGLTRLAAMSAQRPLVGALVIGFMVILLLTPRMVFALNNPPALATSVDIRNEFISRFEGVVARYRVFSTIPRISLMDRDPALMEPYLRSYFYRMGRHYAGPALEEIRQGAFEGVITYSEARAWRGIPHIDPELHQVIAASYAPVCSIRGLLLHTPVVATERSRQLVQEMKELGCAAIPLGVASEW
jgi:hypothetical protein